MFLRNVNEVLHKTLRTAFNMKVEIDKKGLLHYWGKKKKKSRSVKKQPRKQKIGLKLFSSILMELA